MKKQTFLINLILSFLVGLATFLIIPCDENDDVVADAIDGIDMRITAEIIDQLKAATAVTEKYSTIDQALEEDYVDINLVQENAGLRLLEAELLKTVFNPAISESLVYNEQHDGITQLAAAE